MLRLFRPLILVVVVVVTLVVTASARGAYQEPALNAVASSVAGHPVIVSCAASSFEWAQFQTSAGYTAEQDGFTYVSRGNVIYLSPRVCQTLVALLKPAHDDVGPWWASLAIKTLIHESVHQRGIISETVTDCTALPLVTQYAVSSFGYPATVATYVYTKTKVGTFKRVKKNVPNPILARLAVDAYQWHLAQPPEYQGGC